MKSEKGFDMYLNYDDTDRLFVSIQDYTSSNDIIFCNQEDPEEYIQRDCINFCNENEIPYIVKRDDGIKYFYFRSDLVAFFVKKRLELINILD